MKPIQRAKPLAWQVYEWLKNSILTGSVRAGERIVETKIAADLKVSRSPVREAIRLLTSEHLLTEQDGNIYVFQPTLHDFQELYELRLAIEPAAAAKVAGNPNVNERAAVCNALEQNLLQTRACLQAGNWNGLLELNASFHQTICESSGNTRFIYLIENASALIRYYCLLVLNRNNQQTNILREHTDIYIGIREGQSDRTFDAMRRHIRKDVQVIQSLAHGLAVMQPVPPLTDEIIIKGAQT